MIKIPQHPRYSENKDKFSKPNAQPCVVCGKAVTKPRWMVHVHDGGLSLVTEKEAKTMDESEDLGAYPLGNDCYRKHPELQPYASRNPDTWPKAWTA
jgi:hypothetical protein